MILIEKTVFLYAKRFFFYIKYAVSNEKDLTMKESNPYKRLYLIIIKCNITTDVLGDTSGI